MGFKIFGKMTYDQFESRGNDESLAELYWQCAAGAIKRHSDRSVVMEAIWSSIVNVCEEKLMTEFSGNLETMTLVSRIAHEYLHSISDRTEQDLRVLQLLWSWNVPEFFESEEVLKICVCMNNITKHAPEDVRTHKIIVAIASHIAPERVNVLFESRLLYSLLVFFQRCLSTDPEWMENECDPPVNEVECTMLVSIIAKWLSEKQHAETEQRDFFITAAVQISAKILF